MTTLAVATFLALLTLLAVAGIAITWIGVALSRFGGVSLSPLRAGAQPAALWVAFGVALAATGGSLYFSEVAHFTPCLLCWYQRIAMYPLVIILGVAALRGDFAVRRYVLPLSVIGGLISVYHIAVERLPTLAAGSSCSAIAPCDLKWIDVFGFITIPTMAFVAFAAIATVLFVFAQPTTPEEEEQQS